MQNIQKAICIEIFITLKYQTLNYATLGKESIESQGIQ